MKKTLTAIHITAMDKHIGVILVYIFVLLKVTISLYVEFCRVYHNKTVCKQACTDLSLQVMITSPQMRHVTKVYGVISTSVRTTKAAFCKMLD